MTRSRTSFRSFALTSSAFTALALVASLSARCALATDAPAPAATSGGAAAAKSAKDEPAPAEMVLCRSPRGAVFARDAKVGCKFGARLDSKNLVDFAGAGATGGVGGCSLHPAQDHSAADCEALCRTAAPGSSCVVAVGRGTDGAWTSFARGTPVAGLVAAKAIVVCCGAEPPAAK